MKQKSFLNRTSTLGFPALFLPITDNPLVSYALIGIILIWLLAGIVLFLSNIKLFLQQAKRSFFAESGALWRTVMVFSILFVVCKILLFGPYYIAKYWKEDTEVKDRS